MKKLFRRLLILFLVFLLAGAGALFWITRQNHKPVSYTQMKTASLPLVHMDFEGMEINSLHGYTEPMDIAFMKDSMTPLPEDRTLSFDILHYGNNIHEVGFEVRKADKTLVEEGTAKTLVKSGEKVNVTLTLQDLLSKETEYMLTLKVKTDEKECIYYYTRIRFYDDTHLAEQVAFVKHFSDLTYADELSSELTAQLESNNEADNTSFGYTDIHGSFRHVMWSNYKPKRVSSVKVNINQFNAMVAGIELTYLAAHTEEGVTDTIQVREFMTVRYVSGKIWLIAYERTADQVFQADDQTIVDGQIRLGIISPDKLPVEVRENGDHTVFAMDGELFSYDKSKNEICTLFSFKQSDDDGERTGFGDHEFRIINVEENGDVAFTVYGYMNRGAHEGECGLVFYRYSSDNNALTEEVFIPSDKPYSVLKDEIGTLSYVGEDQQFYLMFNSSIYAIDFAGQEYVEMINGMGEDSYVVSPDSTAIAWQEGEDVYGCKSIQVNYLDDGTSYTIHAGEGECIRVLGFNDGDFIYGVARESDIERGNLIVHFPMYQMIIMDRNQTVQMSYQKPGLYIREASVSAGRIDLTRETKDPAGNWNAAPEDSLVQNLVDDGKKSVVVSSWSDITKTTYTLDLSSGGNKKKLLSIIRPKEVKGAVGRRLTLVSTAHYGEEDNRYYAYSHGKLQDICYSASQAIRTIYDDMGFVTDAKGAEVWSRANRKLEAFVEVPVPGLVPEQEKSLETCLNMMLRKEGISIDVANDLAQGSSAFEILGKYLNGRAMDLQGCLLNQVLYYVDQGYPVLAVTEGNKAELILGFDMYKNLIVYNPMSGETYKIKDSAAENYYAVYGYPFITYMNK